MLVISFRYLYYTTKTSVHYCTQIQLAKLHIYLQICKNFNALFHQSRFYEYFYLFTFFCFNKISYSLFYLLIFNYQFKHCLYSYKKDRKTGGLKNCSLVLLSSCHKK